ncbi:uncharacterized protein LOC119280569 [Triticum dicoccoides]|uniref:uncharacterized protein LOC119280569 n=1 Tax=Triticum dicoccoides TaxID=85692 RepID=UPI00188F4043|nr:uncharacterized protein LOC119280569 [Triticum dicoccoides]
MQCCCWALTIVIGLLHLQIISGLQNFARSNVASVITATDKHVPKTNFLLLMKPFQITEDFLTGWCCMAWLSSRLTEMAIVRVLVATPMIVKRFLDWTVAWLPMYSPHSSSTSGTPTHGVRGICTWLHPPASGKTRGRHRPRPAGTEG